MKAASLLAALALAAPQYAGGQVASRVAEVGDGTVRFAYATKDGVEICDQGVRMGDRHMRWNSRVWDEGASDCRVGSAEVELEVRGGRVHDVNLVKRLRDRTSGAVDLGTIGAQQAADFLLGLARAGGSADGAEAAIFPAMIADADEVWQMLMPIAKDRALHGGVRRQALFWLGQEAASAATDGLSDVALDEDEDQEIRNSAIFALSQRAEGEGVPALMELARSGRGAETRRTAMFWLAQTDRDEIVDFFEAILLGRSRQE